MESIPAIIFPYLPNLSYESALIAAAIQEKFDQTVKNRLQGIDQVQSHLNDKKATQGWRYELTAEMLTNVLQLIKKFECDLGFVKHFDDTTIHNLPDGGIR